jgi:hypothetical protein
MQSIETACRVCGSPCSDLWNAPLLDLSVRYMHCARCGYVQTEQPYWLDRAYGDSINSSDTGIMARNLRNSHVVLATLLALGNWHQRVVDFAGGYGILTRLLRDYGVEALWSDRFSENLLARGFEHSGESAGLVTAFEAFEHFVNPGAELDKMFAVAPNVLLSTEVIPDPAPPPDRWWYYGREHGQHIGFFRMHTLRFLAASRARHLISDGHTYHLITERRINPFVWLGLCRLKRLLPVLAHRRLKSKTWDDHLRILRRSTHDPSSAARDEPAGRQP